MFSQSQRRSVNNTGELYCTSVCASKGRLSVTSLKQSAALNSPNKKAN